MPPCTTRIVGADRSHTPRRQANFWRTNVGIGERLLRTTLHTELLELLHGLEEDVADIRADAEARHDHHHYYS